MSPHRPRPSWIADNPRDDMQVKLTNDITKGADIDLIRPRMTFQERAARPASSINCV